MVKKIAITGRPGCGKTTLCRKIAERVEADVGGLLTEEIREEGKRVGFRLQDLATGEGGTLAHVRDCSGPGVGKYFVCPDQLDLIGVGAIELGLREKDLLIVDEIGPMELKSRRFVQAVERALEAEIDCLFTIHRRSKHPLLKKVREGFQVKKLTPKNRDRAFEKLSSAFSKR